MAEDSEFQRVQRVFGILFMVRTRRFQNIMDSLGARRVSKPIGWFLLYLMPVAAAMGLFLFLSDLGILLSPRGAAVAANVRTLSILGNIGIPGINPYIPLVYGWVALFVAMVVHEGAHGIIARSLGIPVKSSGLVFFLFVPVGAFVEPDEAAIRSARVRDTERVLAGGAGVNLIVGVVSLLLLFGVVSTMTPVSNGYFVGGVIANSPAATQGIKFGDFITMVNGSQVTTPQSIQNSTWYKPGGIVNITIFRDGRTIQLDNFKLNASGYLLGVADGDLKGLVSTYVSPTLKDLTQYICIPTLPVCQTAVPFSDFMGKYYTSPFGSALPAVTNLLFWLFFLNFNLAIFNALPIWPFDGGQAFQVGIRALSKDRMSEGGAQRVTVVVSFAILAILLVVILGPYSGLF